MASSAHGFIGSWAQPASQFGVASRTPGGPELRPRELLRELLVRRERAGDERQWRWGRLRERAQPLAHHDRVLVFTEHRLQSLHCFRESTRPISERGNRGFGNVAAALRPNADLMQRMVRWFCVERVDLGAKMSPLSFHQGAKQVAHRAFGVSGERGLCGSLRQPLEQRVVPAAPDGGPQLRPSARALGSELSEYGSAVVTITFRQCFQVVFQAFVQHVEIARRTELRAQPTDFVAQALGPRRVEECMEGTEVGSESSCRNSRVVELLGIIPDDSLGIVGVQLRNVGEESPANQRRGRCSAGRHRHRALVACWWGGR
jgi:hypothetical protein